MNAPGPCLCGDPECGRCFPRSGRRFSPGDLADVLAAYSVALARNAPAPNLDVLAPVDVAWLVELTVRAVQAKNTRRDRDALDEHLDSRLAGQIVDLVRQADLDADVAEAER